MGDRTRRTVWFEGRVQGVGFRYTACEVAARFAVTGYVRNLHDGRVELLAEGPPDEIDRFVTSVRNAMRGYAARLEHVDEPPTGEFDGFGVRY